MVEADPPAHWATFGDAAAALDPAPFASPIQNFYMTDPISRASETMAKCTAEFALGGQAEATGTHG